MKMAHRSNGILGESIAYVENPEIAYDDLYTYPVVCFFIYSEDGLCDDSTCVYLEEFADSCDLEVSFEWVLDGDTYYFTNTSFGEDGESVYQWSVDGIDWSDAENPTLGAGDIEAGSIVCLEIYDEISECEDSYCFEFPEEEPCEIGVSFEWVLEDGVYYFTNTSEGGGEEPIYQWSVDGTDWSDDENPTLGAGDVEDGSVICLEIINEELDCTGDTCIVITVEEEPCELFVSFSYEIVGEVIYFTNTSVGEGDASVYSWWVNDFLWSDDENASLDLDEIDDSALVCFEIYDELTECTQMSCLHIDLSADTMDCFMEVDFGMEVVGEMVYFTDITIDGPSTPVYAWYDDGVLFSELPSPIVALGDIDAESEICLKVSDEFETCIETECKTFYSEDELGLNDVERNVFELYPNPANEQITIQLGENVIGESITIYNSFGQRIMLKPITGQMSNESIEITHLSSGLYTVILTDITGKQTLPVRFVKQ
jgi:hypothetical protein